MAIIEHIRFRDIDQNEKAEVDRIRTQLGLFKAIEQKRPLTTTELDEQTRLNEIIAELKAGGEVCEPLFIGVRDLFNASEGILGAPLVNHESGVMVQLDEEAIVKASLTLGLLMADGVKGPPVKVVDVKSTQYSKGGDDDAAAAAGGAAATGASSRRRNPAAKTIVANTEDPLFDALSERFFAAVGEARGAHKLAVRVLPILAVEGDPDGRGGARPSVDAAEFARVVRALKAKGFNNEEPGQLRRRVNEVLDSIQAVGENRPIADSVLDLPELDTVGLKSYDPALIQLSGAAICSAMLEELKGFDVVDKLLELYQAGMLTIGPGEAGKMLYTYWKDTPNRMSPAERGDFYATLIGRPSGSANNSMVNRDFNDLWLRFVSSVSNFVRQNEVDQLLRASIPSAVSHQQVRKAARDLAGNLSLHGYGMAYYAALEMQDQIKFMIKLLSDKDIMQTCGATTMWDVIDYYATMELGGAKTSSRYRTLATCGTIITAWLANNLTRISESTGPLLDRDAIRFPTPRPAGQKATTHPTDYDLVNACELWLADTATSDDRVAEMSQPREAPVMTSRPVQIPAIAREMLDGLGGIGMGMSAAKH